MVPGEKAFYILNEILNPIDNKNYSSMWLFNDNHWDLMCEAKGSTSSHQDWEYGYIDHIYHCLSLAKTLYESLSSETLPFTLESAVRVLYFHDIEKLWKYPCKQSMPYAQFGKWFLYTVWLKEIYRVNFTEEELNALRYIHGENEDYTPGKRVMNPLAAFCHCVDVMSARIWFDKHSFDWSE